MKSFVDFFCLFVLGFNVSVTLLMPFILLLEHIVLLSFNNTGNFRFTSVQVYFKRCLLLTIAVSTAILDLRTTTQIFKSL